MDFFTKFLDIFWNEKIWLPPNVTWKDIEPLNDSEADYPDFKHLLWPFLMSFVMIFLRFIIENNLAAPIGRFYGVKATKAKPPQPNVILESNYKKNSKLTNKITEKLTKQLDLTDRDVERWWRNRKAQDKPTKLQKFCENFFRCFYYTFSFTFGLIVLWNKPWLWEIKECWYNYPFHAVSNDIWWYYMISMAFYWSLTFTQFVDHKRKDFWQMFIHHIVALALLMFSWICNYHRIGSLVLIIHDFSDIFLEAAKFLKYAGLHTSSDIFAGIFTISWPITRDGLYLIVVYRTIVDIPKFTGVYPAYFIFITFLTLLLILNLIWTYMLVIFVMKILQTNRFDRDIRSSSDDSEVSDCNSKNSLKEKLKK